MSVAVTEKVARLLAVALVTLLPLPVLLFSASHCCVRASKLLCTASLPFHWIVAHPNALHVQASSGSS